MMTFSLWLDLKFPGAQQDIIDAARLAWNAARIELAKEIFASRSDVCECGHLFTRHDTKHGCCSMAGCGCVIFIPME